MRGCVERARGIRRVLYDSQDTHQSAVFYVQTCTVFAKSAVFSQHCTVFTQLAVTCAVQLCR